MCPGNWLERYNKCYNKILCFIRNNISYKKKDIFFEISSKYKKSVYSCFNMHMDTVIVLQIYWLKTEILNRDFTWIFYVSMQYIIKQHIIFHHYLACPYWYLWLKGTIFFYLAIRNYYWQFCNCLVWTSL